MTLDTLKTFIPQFVGQTAAYFMLVSAVFFIVWKWGRMRFAGRRVHRIQRFDKAQLFFELKHTLATLAIGSVNAFAIIALQQAGFTQLDLQRAWPWWQVAAAAVGLIAFNDLWFYSWHRLMHHPKLFRYVHAVHHRSVDTNPFSSYSFHWVEAFLLGAWTLPLIIFVPIPVLSLGVVMVIGLLNNVMSHIGYEFLPRFWLRVPLLKWSNTATFHGLHHARSHGNYGLFSRVWDRAFGTELSGYEETFNDRSAS